VVATSSGLNAQQKTDPGAGGWQMIGLSSATQFTVAPPAQTSSFDYQVELTAIKSAQARLTAAQRKAIAYWSGGGVLRWNEILLGLVSRFNLPPGPNADNSYPVPGDLRIANFWADGPSTPTPPGHWNFIALPYVRKAEFSEVPAARAMALLNMAMHDAAVGSRDVKYFYFNPRPSHMDPELESLIGLPNFPSYTSGHSTFSGAAAEVLSYLFPADAATLEAQKEEASISRLYGGIHDRTDLEVGKAHGKRIGGYTVSFARVDGADR
jgi:hypothetical protein